MPAGNERKGIRSTVKPTVGARTIGVQQGRRGKASRVTIKVGEQEPGSTTERSRIQRDRSGRGDVGGEQGGLWEHGAQSIVEPAVAIGA